MDIIALSQALVSLLAPILPWLVKAGEKSVEEIGKKVGESSWNFAKKIWSRLSPKLNANPVAKEAVADVVQNPKDEDSIAAFRGQLKKLLISDPSLARELFAQLNDIENASRQININIGNINIGGNVYGGNFVGGTGNVFQNGMNNYHYTVNIGKIDRVVYGRDNRMAEMQEVQLSFLQPDSTYPKYSWIDKANVLEIMAGQNSRVTDEKWEPTGINHAILRNLLIAEINRWTLKGWELVETDPEKLFITEYDSAETIASAVGSLLSIPTGTARRHWRIYYGARFHIRRFVD